MESIGSHEYKNDSTNPWVYVFQHMVDSGAMSQLDGDTLKVYMAAIALPCIYLKKNDPLIGIIGYNTGLTNDRVINSIELLREQGYLRNGNM